MKCDLCEEEKITMRDCTFGTKTKSFCARCLSQWQIENDRVVLRDRVD